MPALEIGSLVIVLLIGLFAGVIGGLLGVGGSVIMIPALTFAFGAQQHLYQAAAMVANVAVAVPATLRHHQARAVRLDVLRWMLPAALLSVMLGVWLSNRAIFRGSEGGIWLGRILAVFLLVEVWTNLRKLGTKHAIEPLAHARVTRPRSTLVGGLMGTIGGLLGIGGGALAVPLQQALLRMPLRNAIANSAAVMVFSAALGAVYKNATLTQHTHGPWDGLLLAAMLAPGCILGGHLGATLTHRLPLRQVRIAFVILMLVAAARMMAIPWP